MIISINETKYHVELIVDFRNRIENFLDEVTVSYKC